MRHFEYLCMSVIKPALQRPELISYFLGANNYSWLYFRDGEKKLLAKPIGYLETQLPGFVRIHKTILVNPACVAEIHPPVNQKMGGGVLLETGEAFPVSRRRWSEVNERLQVRTSPKIYAVPSANGSSDKNPTAIQSEIKTASRSIYLITNDEQNAVLTKQTIEENWPLYQVFTASQSAHLPGLLRQLPPQAYPALLIFDARKVPLERMHTLQRLKEDAQLSKIPIVLLVIPADQMVIEGYSRKANSVISMPDRYSMFVPTVERVCQFWLSTVSLPGTGR